MIKVNRKKMRYYLHWIVDGGTFSLFAGIIKFACLCGKKNGGGSLLKCWNSKNV